MPFENPPQDRIREILSEAKTIAVVGLSDNPERTSHMVAKAMQERGYRIIPVNPNVDEVLGEQGFDSLLDVAQPVDIVNVFRRSEHTVPIAEQAVKIGAGTLWLQQGIYHEKAAEIARAGGLEVIMDLCIKVADSVLNPR